MGREVRRVSKDWEHPKNRYGKYKPLHKGSWYQDARDEWVESFRAIGLQETIDSIGMPPDKNNYMPDWDESEKTHLMMYEDTSEGTPISPAFETPEELARWLADNRASAFAGMTATYEQWLATCKSGWAVSAICTPGKGMVSGVEGCYEQEARNAE